MDEIYTAKVKNIKEGTIVNNSTSFVSGMKSSIGKTLEFRRTEEPDWYQETESKYIYHCSWLENLEKQMNTPETKYLVVSVRKSDGQTFFPENANHRKGIDNYVDAYRIAESKTRLNSKDYMYVVYVCSPMVSMEIEVPVPNPIKITFY